MNYETIIVTFAEPIRTLDGFFDDPETWGVETLKEVGRQLRKYTLHCHRRLPGSHYFRIQHELRLDVAGAQYAGCES